MYKHCTSGSTYFMLLGMVRGGGLDKSESGLHIVDINKLYLDKADTTEADQYLHLAYFCYRQISIIIDLSHGTYFCT